MARSGTSFLESGLRREILVFWSHVCLAKGSSKVWIVGVVDRPLGLRRRLTWTDVVTTVGFIGVSICLQVYMGRSWTTFPSSKLFAPADGRLHYILSSHTISRGVLLAASTSVAQCGAVWNKSRLGGLEEYCSRNESRARNTKSYSRDQRGTYHSYFVSKFNVHFRQRPSRQ